MRAFLLPLTLTGCSLFSPQEPDTELAERLAGAVREAHPDWAANVVDAGEVEVLRPGAESLHMYLDNLRDLCAPSEEACAQAIAQRVRSLDDLDAAARASAEQLRPVLKPAAYLSEVDRVTATEPDPAKAAGSRVLRAPFVGDLAVVWVLDMPESMALVNQATLMDLGMSQEALAARARQNLADCCGNLPVQPVPDVPGVFQVWVGDSYEAARLVLHDRWGPLAETVPGDLVVAAPNRDTVLFTGSEDGAGLGVLASAAEEMSQGAYALSSQILLWQPEGWKVVSLAAEEAGAPEGAPAEAP
jgi:uncharacterized protein YtpQ (UPF0354 family)